MWSKCKNWGKCGITIISIITIAVGLLLIGCGFLLEKGIVKVSFISIGLAVVSIGIAFCSIHLSVKSGERLTTIANAIFMEIVDIFEDKRIQLLQHPDWLGLEGTIWKCKTYVDRAYALHKSTEIDEENRHTLFKWFNDLIEQLKFYSDKLEEEHIENIRHMVDKFKDFGLLRKGDIEQLNKIEKTVEEFKIKSSKK